MKRLLTSVVTVDLLLAAGLARSQITPYPWAPIGPRGDLTSDIQTIGVNGRIRSIEVRPVNSSTFYVYAGASSGGLWRSRLPPAPPVWASLGDNLPNPSVGALAVNPSNPDDILVGIGDYARYDDPSTYGGGGLQWTTDAGGTWTNPPLSLGNANLPSSFFRILYVPNNPNVVLAASSSGLLRSQQGPSGPFQLVLSGLVSDLAIDPSNPNTQYACADATGMQGPGVYKSVTAGLNWFRLSSNSDFPNPNVGRGSLSVCQTFPSTLVYAYVTNCNIADILLSANGGTNWSSIKGDFFQLPGPSIGNGQGCHAQAIAIKPDDPNQIFVATADFSYTSNGGQHWASWSPSFKTHQDFNQIYFSPVTGNNGMWECNDGGLFLHSLLNNSATSFNGDNVTGLQVSSVADMDALHSVRAIANQDDSGAGTADGGQSWSGSSCCDAYNVVITRYGLFSRAYWYLHSSGSSAGSIYAQYIGGGFFDVSSTRTLQGLFYGRFQDKVYSIDWANRFLVSRAATSTDVAPWTNEAFLPLGTNAVWGDTLNGQTLFVWGSPAGDTLTVLKNNGGTWSVARNSPVGGGTNAILRVVASTERVAESWAVMSPLPKLLHTLDEWQTWTPVDGNLDKVTTNASVRDLAVMPFNPRTMFAATVKGVFATEDGGATWEPFQTGLPAVLCNRLRYVTDYNHSGYNALVVGTFGHGVYERPIPRPPLVYVDQRPLPGFPDGSFEHPLLDLPTGLSTTPSGGTMALNGMTIYTAPAVLTNKMTITAYEAPALLTH